MVVQSLRMKINSLRKYKSVSASIIQKGFEVSVDRKKYQVIYPPEVWNSFPHSLHQVFAETVAYYFTYHLYFKEKTRLEYYFAPSLPQSLFINGLLMTLQEAILELPEKKFTPDYLFKLLYQSQHDVRFYPPNNNTSRVYDVKPYVPDTQKVIIPMSLGKDSLLTFAVTRELGLKQRLVFFVEPQSTNEEKNKKKLGQLFMDEFGVPISYIPVTLGSLREKGGTQWGWDMMLTQYTLLLIPYLYYDKANFLLWSQEQNYELSSKTDFGLTLTMNYDETSKWRMYLTSLLSYFGSPAGVGSLNEPLREFTDTFILHNRYPEIAKYQLSCDNDHKNAGKNRWCYSCEDCTWHYIYFLAIGIDPLNVGFSENMLSINKLQYYSVFKRTTKPERNYVFQHTDDFLFAMYLAYKGPVINKFKDEYLDYVQKNIQRWWSLYYSGLHSMPTVPYSLRNKISFIYSTEIKKMQEKFSSYL